MKELNYNSDEREVVVNDTGMTDEQRKLAKKAERKPKKELTPEEKEALELYKKQKEEQQLRDSVQIGDEITTIGGIVGRIVTVKEDSIVIETGADRTKMKLMRWAIQTNNTGNERAEAEKKALEAAQAAEKEERKKGKRSKKNVADEDPTT